MPADPEAMQRMLAELRAEYRRALPAKLSEIEGLWQGLSAGAEPAARFSELRRLAHTLAGAARTFGLPAVTDAARALEEALLPLCEPGATARTGDVQRIAPLVDALKQSAGAD